MADRDPLQFFIGRATADGGFKTKKDGTIITTKDGKKVGKVRLAIQYGYGDDADKEFINAETLKPELAAATSEVKKGESVAVVGVRREGGDYEDNIMAFQIGVIDWIGVKKSDEDDEF